ncbi:hypothetical protein KXW98_005372 [Aspergillus fumigatus]|nr:hypothetical protein KXX45_005843 [Aspergillus fumigatus]KAH1288142.1 hypothetical protein KXX30_007910 [Aspergillus fumigatus]KAH1317273.1 hypothetical protein KXX38_001784 [Aspergillus fumigatus]KAH1323900.1 hypothetical protein KXX47_000677 [Aspergillus fumigatus]KAH1357443.1 hypothetical protein KXX14_009400 [Aspergillus fumigatus]
MSPPKPPPESPEFDWWRLLLPEPPIWWRVILLVLAVGSFLPQILLIQRKQTINGVSSMTILSNLIIATEHLSIYIFLLFVGNEQDGHPSFFLHYPTSAGDRFSLWHCAVVTILFVALFIQILIYSNRKLLLVATYTIYLLTSIVPLMIINSIPDHGPQSLWSAIFYGVHSICIYPILTALGVLGIFCQAREILVTPLLNALSVQGLAMQALIFTLVSVTWIPSLPFPYEKLEGHYNWNTFTVWYGAVGFIIIDSFAFALGQAVLLLLALHRSSSSKASIQRGTETEPLLGHPAEM